MHDPHHLVYWSLKVICVGSFFGQLPCLVFPELLGVCGLASDINLGTFSVMTSSNLSPVSSGLPSSVSHLL